MIKFFGAAVFQSKNIEPANKKLIAKKQEQVFKMPFRPKAVSVMVAAIASSTKMVNHWASWGKRIYNE